MAVFARSGGLRPSSKATAPGCWAAPPCSLPRFIQVTCLHPDSSVPVAEPSLCEGPFYRAPLLTLFEDTIWF